MTSRLLLVTAFLAYACAPPVPAPGAPEARGPEATRRVREALAGPLSPEGLTLDLRVPGDGTVLPWRFPPVDMRWRDRYRATAFRLRVEAPGGRVILEAVTSARRHRFSEAEWERLRAAVGEGGAFEVELRAASVSLDGACARGPAAVRSKVRFSGPGEHPTGFVTWSRMTRDPGASLADFRASYVPVRLSMDGQVSLDIAHIPGQPDRLNEVELAQLLKPARAQATVDYSQTGRQTGHTIWSEQRGHAKRCSGCHTYASNGRYVAIQSDDYAKDAEEVSDTCLHYVDRETQETVFKGHNALGALFSPVKPTLAVSPVVGSLSGKDTFVSFHYADIHAIDLDARRQWPLPGANLPDRCEMLADWSPDGETVIFSRSMPGTPCRGKGGRNELATVPWNGGRGGEPTPLDMGAATGKGSDYLARYSPDGRFIMFFRSQGGFYAANSADLWIVPAAGGEARKLSVSTDAQESWHAFSPDGKWIVFVSNRERVDRLTIHMARFFEDGHTAPAFGVPYGGIPDAFNIYVYWNR